MKPTPIILSLIAGVAASVSASALAPADAFTLPTQEALLASPQEKQEKKPEKKTDEKSKSSKKEEKAEKVTVWVLDATGSG